MALFINDNCWLRNSRHLIATRISYFLQIIVTYFSYFSINFNPQQHTTDHGARNRELSLNCNRNLAKFPFNQTIICTFIHRTPISSALHIFTEFYDQSIILSNASA